MITAKPDFFGLSCNPMKCSVDAFVWAVVRAELTAPELAAAAVTTPATASTDTPTTAQMRSPFMTTPRC